MLPRAAIRRVRVRVGNGPGAEKHAFSPAVSRSRCRRCCFLSFYRAAFTAHLQTVLDRRDCAVSHPAATERKLDRLA